MAEFDQIRQRTTTEAAPTALRVAAEFAQLPVVRAVTRTLAVLNDLPSTRSPTSRSPWTRCARK
ncbi:anti-sigma factor RsbW [Rhodococcus wratislaviensis IFP 2016]|nr:anti-sigma factor RsbW [Rhodococcus wratislaviensis IFP 2016]